MSKTKGKSAKYTSYNNYSKELTLLKQNPDFEFLKEVDKFALQNSLKDLNDGFNRFFKKQNKYPVFKKKNNNLSYTTNFTNNNIVVSKDYIKLPKIGKLKINKKVDLTNIIKINSATIKKEGNKYYVAVQVEYRLTTKEKNYKVAPATNKIVGCDLGIKEYLTISTGEVIGNPKYLIDSQKKLAKLQRKASKCVKNSNNQKKLYKRIRKLNNHVANQRLDFQHKLSKKLINENQVIVLEDLKVKNLIKNKRLAKHIQDASWGQFISLVKYKSIWYNRTFIQAPSRFPSSQKCNYCGYINKEVKNLKIREWECPDCNVKHNRDMNASLNLKNYGLSII